MTLILIQTIFVLLVASVTYLIGRKYQKMKSSLMEIESYTAKYYNDSKMIKINQMARKGLKIGHK